jgi:hypothetical protein
MEMRGHGEMLGPLVTVGIVAVKIDQDLSSAAFGQDAENFF